MERCKSAARKFPTLPGASRTNRGGSCKTNFTPLAGLESSRAVGLKVGLKLNSHPIKERGRKQMLQNLSVDPEFASKIPSLREEELKQLEENILEIGRAHV